MGHNSHLYDRHLASPHLSCLHLQLVHVAVETLEIKTRGSGGVSFYHLVCIDSRHCRYPYLDYLDIYLWAAEEARLSQCCHYYPSSSWFLPSAWSAAWRLQWMLWPLTWHVTLYTWHVLPETITASSAASWPRCSGSRWTELELLKFLNTPFSIFGRSCPCQNVLLCPIYCWRVFVLLSATARYFY